MSKIITVKVSKGGVGKTTIASNLAKTFSLSHKKTLIIDLDSQSNLSKTFMQEIDDEKLTSSNLLGDEDFKLVNSVYHVGENLDLIVSDIGLHEVSKYLESTKDYVFKLNLRLRSKEFEKYDIIILDLSPGVADSITEIAIASSNLLICPTHFDIDSLSGLVFTINDMSRLFENNIVDDNLKYLIVPNRYDRRFEKDNQKIYDILYENLEKEFIAEPIRENSHIKKARMNAMTVIEYEQLPENKYDHKRGCEDFEKLARKVLEVLSYI